MLLSGVMASSTRRRSSMCTAAEPSPTVAVGRQRWAVVLLCAGASLGLYVSLLAVVPALAWAEPSHASEVFPWVQPLTRESVTYLRETGGLEEHPRASLRFLVLVLGLFTAYGLALLTVGGQRSRPLEGALFGVGALFLALQTMGPAMLSTDIFGYVVYGRILAFYQGDPYSDVSAVDPGDPYLPLWGVPHIPSWYGPLWTLLSAGFSWLGGEHIGLTVLLFRGLAVAAALGAGALLWSGLRQAAPHRAAQGLVFFLWNPLLVLEAGLSGHNDVVMAAPLLLGIWLHLRGRRALATTALTLSVLVKYITGLIVPLYVLMVLRDLSTWRDRWQYLALSAAGTALVVAVVLVLASPGLEVPVVQAASNVSYYSNNLQELLLWELGLGLAEGPGYLHWLQLGAWVAFGAFWAVAAYRAKSLKELLVWSVAVVLAAYWLVVFEFWPWHVIWALALAALVPTSRPARLAVLLSATVLSLYISGGYDGSDEEWVYAFRSLPALVLPLVLFLLSYFVRLPTRVSGGRT